MTRFSVVVPTRDRPDLLSFCLESIAAQTHDDVEVVIADNPVEHPARDVFERWRRAGWRYLAAETPLTMYDNFERACAAATGDYVCVVIDKTVLHPSAVAVANEVVQRDASLDLVTWENEGYEPLDERERVGHGRYVTAPPVARAGPYDPAAELAHAFAFDTPRASDPAHYCRGKIVFGAYSRRLVDEIVSRTGRLFYPLSPDYSSRVPALAFARSAYDLGRPLLVSYVSARSNGRRAAVDPNHSRAFLVATDPASVDALPLPGLYSSQHNIVAYDYVMSAQRCPPGTVPAVNMLNLVRRIREDLDSIPWTDGEQRAEQYAILESAERRLGIVPRTTVRPRRPPRQIAVAALTRVPAAHNLLRRAAGRPPRIVSTFDSPVAAARAADRNYTARTAGARTRAES